MSQNGVISSENLPTAVAVALVIGILSLALNFYNFQQIRTVVVGVAALEIKADKAEKAANTQQDERVAKLEARLAELEARASASAAAPPPAEAPAAPQ